jgi:hypothetical protein
MRDDRSNILKVAFPTFISERFYFECADGWFDLIADIAQYVSSRTPYCSAVQIKEKFGGLRLYYEGPNSEFISGVIRMAEAIAYKTCEVCGNQGTVRKGRWIRTLCDQCHQASQNVDNPN